MPETGIILGHKKFGEDHHQVSKEEQASKKSPSRRVWEKESTDTLGRWEEGHSI